MNVKLLVLTGAAGIILGGVLVWALKTSNENDRDKPHSNTGNIIPPKPQKPAEKVSFSEIIDSEIELESTKNDAAETIAQRHREAAKIMREKLESIYAEDSSENSDNSEEANKIFADSND